MGKLLHWLQPYPRPSLGLMPPGTLMPSCPSSSIQCPGPIRLAITPLCPSFLAQVLVCSRRANCMQHSTFLLPPSLLPLADLSQQALCFYLNKHNLFIIKQTTPSRAAFAIPGSDTHLSTAKKNCQLHIRHLKQKPMLHAAKTKNCMHKKASQPSN